MSRIFSPIKLGYDYHDYDDYSSPGPPPYHSTPSSDSPNSSPILLMVFLVIIGIIMIELTVAVIDCFRGWLDRRRHDRSRYSDLETGGRRRLPLQQAPPALQPQPPERPLMLELPPPLPPSLPRGPLGKECVICLEDIKSREPCSLLSCRHVFHKSCIDQWLSQASHCPICRSPVGIS